MTDPRTMTLPQDAARLVEPRQRDILRHTLGLGRGLREYRNHFVTGPGSTDYADCEALVASGMMTRREGNPLSGGAEVYHVTDAGRAALRVLDSIARERAAMTQPRASAAIMTGQRQYGSIPATWSRSRKPCSMKVSRPRKFAA